MEQDYDYLHEDGAEWCKACDDHHSHQIGTRHFYCCWCGQSKRSPNQDIMDKVIREGGRNFPYR